MTQTYFSGIETALIDNISKARDSIKIAVAWFTNARLLEALLMKIDEGVNVELIIRDDYVNNSIDSLPWSDFVVKNGRLYFSSNSKKLHHKYCVIDNMTVISGSYNWTYQAENVNQESVVTLSDVTVANNFAGNFESLKIDSQLVDDVSLLNCRSVVDAPAEEVQFISEEMEISKHVESDVHVLDEASLHYLNKRYEEAMSVLSMSWNKIDSIPDAYEAMAWALARKGKSEEAIMYAENGIRLNDKNPEFHNVIGYVHNLSGNHSKAVECFDKAINLAPNLTTYYWNKILSLYSKNSDSALDKVKLTLIKVASDILKSKDKHTPFNVMQAYIDRGNVRSDKVSRQQDGLKAKAIFDTLDASQQDLHDLDSIVVLRIPNRTNF